MPRHHQQGEPGPDAVEAWREWQDHQFDADYYGRTGRVNPVLHARVGFTLVFLGACFSLLGILSIFSGTLAVGMLVAGCFLLVAGIGVLRWDSRRRRRYQAQASRPRRRRRHKARR